MNGVRQFWLVMTGTVQQFYAVNGLFLASGLSFDLLLYCMPLSLLLISAGGYTILGSDRTLAWIQETVGILLPSTQEYLVETLSVIVENRGLFGLSGFLLYFVLSSAVFGSARLVLNSVFNVESARSFVTGKLTDFMMMLLVSVLMIVTIVANMLLTLFQTLGSRLPFIGDMVHSGWNAISHGIGFLFIVSLFCLLYRFLPNYRLSPCALLVAGMTGAALFQLSRWAFALYVSLAQGAAVVYGALGGLIFFFLWLYYAACVFIIGAIAGSIYEKVVLKRVAAVSTESGNVTSSLTS